MNTSEKPKCQEEGERRRDGLPCSPRFSEGGGQAGFSLLDGRVVAGALPARSPGGLHGDLGTERQDRVTQSHNPPGPARPGELLPFGCLFFSVSFLWVLGARVIGFKAKAKLSFPQIFPKLPLGSSSPGRPESCPGGMGAARTRAGLGKGGRSPHAFPLWRSSLAGSRFCLRWDLYVIPRVLGKEQGRKGHPPHPLHLFSTPLPWKPPRSKGYEKMTQSK